MPIHHARSCVVGAGTHLQSAFCIPCMSEMKKDEHVFNKDFVFPRLFISKIHIFLPKMSFSNQDSITFEAHV